MCVCIQDVYTLVFSSRICFVQLIIEVGGLKCCLLLSGPVVPAIGNTLRLLLCTMLCVRVAGWAAVAATRGARPRCSILSSWLCPEFVPC